MIIDQLPALSGDVVATDEIPVERGTTTYKTTPDKFLAAMPKDAVPTQGSENAVESGGVYDALQTKQNALTFDSAPTQGSSNPVTSGGVYTAIENATPEGFVSYAETQTLTTAQKKRARDNINSESGWTLLWQNANPSSSFATQAVPVDLSTYTEFKVVCIIKPADSSSTEYYKTLIAIGQRITGLGWRWQPMCGFTYVGPTYFGLIDRQLNAVTDAAITFGPCFVSEFNSGSMTGAQNDAQGVPCFIYAR